MIYAKDKRDGKVYEVIGCDALNPITLCKDKQGNEKDIFDKNLIIYFEENKDFEQIKKEYEEQ